MNNINKLKAALSDYISLLVYDSFTLVTRYNMLHEYLVKAKASHPCISVTMLVPYVGGQLCTIFHTDAKIFSSAWYIIYYTSKLHSPGMYE